MKFITPNWPAPANIKALTTTRSGGFSEDAYSSFNLGGHVDDNPVAVEQNRELLMKEAQLPSSPIWLKQTHSTIASSAEHYQSNLDCDASFTQKPGIVCSVLTADCMPVLICNKAGTEIAAIHAGWRGLANGILENTIKTLQTTPGDLMAWMGPALGPKKFEVCYDVRDIFLAHDTNAEDAFKTHNDRYLMDMYLLARQRLNAAGVSNIYGGDHCTATEEDLFFSFRRDGVTGRMASLIWME